MFHYHTASHLRPGVRAAGKGYTAQAVKAPPSYWESSHFHTNPHAVQDGVSPEVAAYLAANGLSNNSSGDPDSDNVLNQNKSLENAHTRRDMGAAALLFSADSHAGFARVEQTKNFLETWEAFSNYGHVLL